ncbi:MAG: HAMP domain-containing protein [Deltaproteobacteria bacterium]|nr:HAMP domain-containing protein [Deltaproteobacteria bacterium]
MAAVAVYLYIAVRLFYEDKTELVYELNQNTVRTLSAEVRADIDRVLDKLRLVAALAVTDKKTAAAREATFAEAFGGEEELVKVAVLEARADAGSKSPQRVFVKTWTKYLEAYRRKDDAEAFLAHVRDVVPVPFEKVTAEGAWVRNSTLHEENSPPLMTVAVAIDTGDASVKRVVYADVRLDRMLESLAAGGITQTVVVDSEGKALASSDQELVSKGADLSQNPLVKKALASKTRSEVHKFDAGGKSFLGSYHRTGVAGVLVVSRVETEQAFAAAERLIRKSLIYALLIVTAAFLCALFFAHHLTAPIQTMLEATHRIARGEFERKVDVRSHDELAVLASSFNSMTEDLRQSRDQIQEYSRDLEKKVKDRTARLEASNIAIKEAQEALVRTTRLASVGEIAGRAAHEVLNPLTNVTTRLEKMQNLSAKPDRDDLHLLLEIVQAWTKELESGGRDALYKSLAAPSTAQEGKTLLEEDVGNLKAIAGDLSRRLDDRSHDLDFLLKEAGRINKIVNGMRQLTRVSGNRRQVPVHKVVADAVATMADLLEKNRIKVETNLCGADPQILADSDELMQVFSNLVRNSMQAIQEARGKGAPVGEPARVWFSTELASRDGVDKVLIRVCDNGPGIAAENLSKVFDASFTTKSAEEGTGLGLSISRRFIRALDGEIIVEKSTAGSETVFLIELPLVTGAQGGNA